MKQKSLICPNIDPSLVVIESPTLSELWTTTEFESYYETIEFNLFSKLFVALQFKEFNYL